MPTLRGLISDSTGNRVSGTLEIKLNSPRIDVSTDPDTVYYPKPTRYQITNGDLATAKVIADDGTIAASATPINLVATTTETYQFRFTYSVPTKEYYLNGTLYTGDKVYISSGTNPAIGWYTGAVYNASTSQTLVEYTRSVSTDLFNPFNAKIPSGSTVEWAVLTSSGVSAENLDTSIYEVARVAANSFGNLIASSVFIPKGNYDNTVVYTKYSTVYDVATKKLYWKISDNNVAGIAVTSTADWMMILEAPASAAQTITLLDAAYEANWDGNVTQALTVNAIYDALQRYAVLASTYTKTETNNQINNALASFVAPPTTTANDQDYTVISNAIANMRSVNSLRRQFLSLEERRGSNVNGGAASTNNVIRQLNTRVGGVSIGAAGSFCTEVTSAGSVRLLAGRYRIRGYATGNRINSCRAYMYNVTAVDNLFDIENRMIIGSTAKSGSNLANGSDSNVISVIQDKEFVLAFDSYVQLRFYVQTPTSVTDALGANSGASLQGEAFAGLVIEWLANN
jgi:hypothetical protein